MRTAATGIALDYHRQTGAGRRLFTQPWLLLCLILVAAAGLRWAYIGHYSLWLDEFLSMEDSTGRGQLHVKLPGNTVIDPTPVMTRLSDAPGLAKIWTSLDTETHPPLYFMLLNLWRHAFGEGDVAARSLSAAASLASIVLMYFLARLLHGTTAALWVCAVMAVAGPQIQYSQEARPYTLVLALLMAAALALVRIEKLGVNWRRSIALFGSVLALLLTQYLAFASIAALGVYALIRLRGRSLAYAVGSFALAGAVFAGVWGPYFLEQARGMPHEHQWMLESETDSNAFRTIDRAAGLPLRYFTEPMKGTGGVAYLASVVFVLPWLLLRRRRDLLLWCLLLIAPIVQVATSDLMRHAWALSIVRYTFLSTGAAYALVGAMLAHKTGWMRHVVPLTITAACLAAVHSAYQRWIPDWREPAEFIKNSVADNDLLIVPRTNGGDWGSAAYLLYLSHYARFTTPSILLDTPADDALIQRLRSARQVWVVTHRRTVPIENLLPGATLRKGFADPFSGTIAAVQLPDPPGHP